MKINLLKLQQLLMTFLVIIQNYQYLPQLKKKQLIFTSIVVENNKIIV